ncbi:hypothetical protein Aduo_014830 [Ancylostoma duodenale]
MSSVLLLQLVGIHLIYVNHAGLLPAQGSDSNPDESGTFEEHGGGGGEPFSDGQRKIPNCRDGMKPNARSRLVNGVKSRNPGLKYNCNLAEQAFLEAGGSIRGAPHQVPSDGTETGMGSSSGLSFQAKRRDGYKPRNFVMDAVKDWEDGLKTMTSTRFGCGLSQTATYYLLVCFFE